jgi:hypothetical protein
MAQQHLEAQQIVNGRLGTIQIDVDGRRREGKDIQNISTTKTPAYTDIAVTGRMTPVRKLNGLTNTGTMTYVDNNDTFGYIFDKIEQQIIPNVTIQTRVEDRGSDRGVREIKYTGVQFDALTRSDVNTNDYLNGTIDFSFDQGIIISDFRPL